MTTKASQTPRKQTMESAKTVEQATEASSQAMKQQMERTVTAFRDMGAFGKENFDAMVCSTTACTKGVETISARAAAFSKQALENHVSAAKSLMTARSMQELIERQTEYARSSFDTYVAELNQMSDVMVGVAREALQPFSERVAALGQMVQVNAPVRTR